MSDAITYWNDVAQEANRVAHTNEHTSEAAARGPVGSARAFAITHLAMHDAYFSINTGIHPTYLADLPAPPAAASPDAAVAAAAHATLSALYPNQKAALDRAHRAAGLTGKGVAEGHAYGLAVAAAMLASRAGDPGLGDDGYAASTAAGHHRPDPINAQQGFHAPFFGARSKCFAVTTRHTLEDPPQIGHAAYTAALDEVKRKGIEVEATGTLPAGTVGRTSEETLIGLFWAYDGAKGIGTPPRLYNQIVREVAEAKANTVADNARLFALVNTAMADAGILAWTEKYRHDLWRPVVGIREHDPSMGTAGVGGNSFDDDCDPGWLPLGAPSTNRRGTANGTPPFPAYPSGHATFGAAAMQATRHFYGITTDGPDDLAADLSFVSDELDGANLDNRGVVRPQHHRAFPDGLWQMIEENGRSRVFLGVHWVFDAFAVDSCTGEMDLAQNVGGVSLGLNIAKDIAEHGLIAAHAAGPADG